MNRWLVGLGAVLILLGGFWPWLAKFPWGRLPGDLRFERPGLSFYFPLTTCLLISAMITLAVWLFRRCCARAPGRPRNGMDGSWDQALRKVCTVTSGGQLSRRSTTEDPAPAEV